MRALRRASCWLLALTVVLFAVVALAQDRIARLAHELTTADDFRVRTQAALALGATKSKRAIEPLCGGLNDSQSAVRAASAAGLGRLHLGGSDCLERRLQVESDDSVKRVIETALKQVRAGAEPAITAQTRYYVAIGKTADHTGRGGHEVSDLVRDGMEEAAENLDQVALAPANETTAQARKRLAQHRGLKAFYLTASVAKPSYSGSGLSVRISIAVFTYPGKSLKGTYSIGLTQEGVSDKDRDSENRLIKMAAHRGLEKFEQNAEQFE
jgi:HEAT repeats